MARKCPQCGSRKWRKDAISGSVVCEDGHVLASVRSENLVAEPTGHVMQKRKITKNVRGRGNRSRANLDFLHGRAAEYLRIQGLQLLLRHQVAALKTVWQLPDALEIVVRELWTYQLAMTPIPQMDKESGSSTPQPEISKASSSQFMDNNRDNRSGSNSDSDREDGSDSDISESSDMADKDESDAELLAQLSEDSDAELDNVGGNSGEPPARKRTKLRVSDTLVCLVLGLWLLRIPFTHVDIESLINTNQIPYINFVYSTLLPAEMFKLMNSDVQRSLNPPRSPPPMQLYEASRRFARILTQAHGQVIPEINVQPLAWHLISQLGGTALTHAQTLKVLYLIDANMSLNVTHLTTFMRKRRNSESTTQISIMSDTKDIVMPELSIVAAWVIVMKLAYGLDGQERLALLRTEPLIGMPHGDMWVKELGERLKSGVLKGTRRDLERLRFDIMEPVDIDRFLDRAEDVLLKDRDFGKGNHLAQFPLHKVPKTPAPDPSPNSWADFHAAAAADPVRLSTARPSRELPLMPGEQYRRYDASDITGELPAAFETVLQAAAEVIGVPVQTVAETVEHFERRMHSARPRRDPPPRENNASPAFRRVRAAGLRESRSLDHALDELGV